MFTIIDNIHPVTAEDQSSSLRLFRNKHLKKYCCLFLSVGGDVKLNLPEPNIPKNGDWKFSRDIQEFNTNAFGKIAFINEGLGGHKPSKV